MMRSSQLWFVYLILIAVLSSVTFAQEAKVDTRRLSIHYWQKMAEQGLVEVASDVPVPAAQYTGSAIHARTVLVDDSPDVPVIEGNYTQSENSISVNPLDNNKVLNSNNSTNSPVSILYGTSGFFTTDGGLTWGGSFQGTGGSNFGDPAATVGLNGTYYVGYISLSGGQGVARSTNEGSTWTPATVSTNPSTDKNHLWVDNSPSSPFVGNLYSTWTDFGGVNVNDIELSRSTNGGVNWSTPINISSAVASGSHDQGVNVQTGPNGEVYAVWAIYDSWPADENALGFAKSTDGGATFAPATRIMNNIRGIRITETSKNQRVNSFPSMTVDISGGSRNGWIYIVWTNIGVPGVNTGPDIDVYMISSSDGGQTWSTPGKVNQDPSGLGKQHYFPWITCDPETGVLSAIFYDDRNVSSTQCEVFVANSLDGGVTWEDFKVSDVSFTPAPIPGLAGGYMGDYLGISARGAKVYPCWTDNRSGHALTYVSPFTLADPTDPNPPSNGTIYSDYTTPTSMELTWTDPTNYTNGDTLLPADFTIEIYRDQVPLTSVSSGVEQFTDNGLNDGQQYTYTLYTKDVFDSLSLPVNMTWHAGGSPIPAAPQNLAAVTDTTQAVLTWDDPTTQEDGTPLDDLDHINIYRDGTLLGSVPPGTQTYTDTPPPGFVYTYTVTAVDNETPPNESLPSNEAGGFVGTTPNFLVWVGLQASGQSAESGDSLFKYLVENGESSFLTNNLFEFGNDLSIYEGVFVVLGIYPNNQVIGAADPEGPALEAALQAGTHIYLEGGDCFNYDPEVGGYNIRPWFSLNDGLDGSSDLFGIVGLNDLSAFSFPYQGENSFMDELVPIFSISIWENNANTDISGVFYAGLPGRSIGVVPSFGGLVDNSMPANMKRRFPQAVENEALVKNEFKARPQNQPQRPFVKKAAYYPELKQNRPLEEFFKMTPKGLQILANTKEDLMAAYIGLFRATSSDPEISVNPTSFSDTLLIGATTTETMTVGNVGGALAADLIYTVTENPEVGWLDVSPAGGTLSPGVYQDETITLDAAGLTAGTYTTTLEVASNDPLTPVVAVAVELVVNEAPVVGFTPDSMLFTLDPSQADSMVMTITNSGAGPLVFTLTDEDVSLTQKFKKISPKYPPYYYGRKLAKGEADSRKGVSPIDGFGGPDGFGYKWIDSDEPGGPVFNWRDITGSGTPVTLSDDDFIEVPLPFTFSFYGVDQNLVKVCSNGYLTFGPAGTDFSNDPIPTPLDPNDYIGPFWDDLNPAIGGTIHYLATSTEFIVQYTNIPHFGSTGVYTFEVILNANGQMLYQYLIMEGELQSATIGIENSDGLDGLEVVFNAPYVHDDLAVRIAAESAWLSENPTSGTVPPGGSMDVQVIANTTGLVGGDYFANVIISSNDPVTPDTTMLVHLQVTGIALISAAPDPLVFPNPVFVNGSDEASLTVMNDGNGVLSVSDITSSAAEFSVNPTSFDVPAFGSQDVTVTFAPTAAGTITGSLTIYSNAGNEPQLGVSVQGEAVNPPIIGVDPTEITESVEVGDTMNVAVQISNTGESDLDWTAGLIESPVTLRITPFMGPVSDQAEAAGPGNTDGKAISLVMENPWDLEVQFNLQLITGALGNAGAEFDGSHFFSTRWASNLLHSVDMSGNLVEEFSIPGVTGLRDLAYDGEFFYGGNAGFVIYQMDFVTKTLVGTINSPTAAVRHIAYDEGYDAFWVGNFGTPPTLVDRNGVTLAVLNTGFLGQYGSAYDDYSAGGPYLWVFDQGSGAGFPQYIHQFDLNTLTPTGFVHDVAADFPGNPGIAGGLWINEGVAAGKASIGGVFQGTPDIHFAYELTNANTWMSIDPTTPNSGTIAPGDVGGFMLRLHPLEAIGYSGSVVISSNDPVTPEVVIPVNLNPVGISGDGLLPTTFAVSRNYPNPFNPSTTIDYQLPQSADVTLEIYNVLGQKVRTLVNTTMQPGRYQVVWDAHNDAGVQVGSGIYIYRFQAGDYKNVQKMVLLK